MQFFLYTSLFLLGVIIGSFLNVFLLRGGTGKWKKGRSVCFSCGKEIRKRDMFPILSYFLLRGRCFFCKSKISFQYPLVEFLNGFLFVLTFVFFFKNDWLSFLNVVLLSGIVSMFLTIIFYDIKHKIIPDGPETILFFLAILKVSLDFFGDRDIHNLIFSLSAGFLSAIPFFCLWFFSKGKWLGFGDVKLVIPLGWIVGFNLVFPSIIFSYWLGGAFVIVFFFIGRFAPRLLLFFGLKNYRLTRKTELPFAPFLIAGFFINLLFPEFSYYLFPFLL